MTHDQLITIGIWVTPFVVALLGWSFKKWIEQLIVERTKPIQETANGGKSLPDANTKLDHIVTSIDTLHGRITDLRSDVSHLSGRFEQHIREAR